MKRIISIIVLSVVFVIALPVLAQDGVTTIEYGQVATGEITNENYEIPFKFVGQQGDVIVVEMNQTDPLGDLNAPVIMLLDAGSRVLGIGEPGFGDVTFATKLPADGEYTLLATRSDGRAGDDVGEFTLRLFKPVILNIGEPVQDMASSETTNYFVVEIPGSFSISYQKLAGDFSPAVSVNNINEESELEEVAILSGKFLSGGVMNVETKSAIAAEVFVVVVQEALWDFNFDEVTADFSITLGVPDTVAG